MKKLTKKEIENIRKNPHKATWHEISRFYILSEDFIREFKDKVDWEEIFKYQTLSEDFKLNK